MATQRGRLTKSELIASFEQLPDDATVDNFVEHLAFITGVEQGMADIAAGRTISHEELLKRWSAA